MYKSSLFAVTVPLLAIASVRGADPTPRKSELPANTWVNLKPSGIRPGWETLHYCPVSEQAVVWTDYKTFSTEYQHSLLGYDGKANRQPLVCVESLPENDRNARMSPRT